MALYKPKNLKPSIDNGPVNTDIEVGANFSFQVEGNEPIKNYSIYIQDPYMLDYKQYKASKDFSFYNSYLDLERVEDSFVRKNYDMKYEDIFRRDYPVFDANKNLTSVINLSYLPNGVNEVVLESVYYQHHYEQFYPIEGSEELFKTYNVDFVIPQSMKGKFLRESYWDFVESLPTVKDGMEELILKKKNISNINNVILKINTNKSVSINSQSLYKSLQDPIAKSHFKEENPFGSSIWPTFGVFDWIFLKFKIGENQNKEPIYYIKGFIPRLRTNILNSAAWRYRHFYGSDKAVLKITQMPESKVYLPSFTHWSEEEVESFTDYGDIVDVGVDKDNNFLCQSFFEQKEFKCRDWDLNIFILNRNITFTPPSEEFLNFNTVPTDINNILFTVGDLTKLTDDFNDYGYPIDSYGNLKTFSLNCVETFQNKMYNEFYLNDTKGYLTWYVEVEKNSGEKIKSAKEQFFNSNNMFVEIKLENDKKIKDIPFSINFSFPKENKLLTYYYGMNDFPSFLRPYTNKGEPYLGYGEIYYKYSVKEENNYFLINHDTFLEILREENKSNVKISQLKKLDIIYYKNEYNYFYNISKDNNNISINNFFKKDGESKETLHFILNSETVLTTPIFYLDDEYEKEIKVFDLSELIPQLKEVKYFSYKIYNIETNQIIKQKENLYSGDLNFVVEFLPFGSYRIEVEVENILGIKGKQSLTFDIEESLDGELPTLKPNTTILNDGGIYIDWSNIPFLYASFSKGEFTENDFYYNYPIAQEDSELKSLYIPEKETLTMNLSGYPCNYIAYCFQPVGQVFGYNEQTGEAETRKVMIMQTDTYWYEFSICMVDKGSGDENYKYWLNIKAINQELEQLSTTLREEEETFIEFELDKNLIVSDQLYYIMLFDKQNKQIHLKIYYNKNDSNVLDNSYVETISFDWNFEEITRDYYIQVEDSEAWSKIFAPKYIQLLGNQVCSYIYGTLEETSIANVNLKLNKEYVSGTDIFFFNPNRTENIEILAENKELKDLSNVTIVKVDKTNDISSIAYSTESYTGNFIDYSIPSKTECFYKIYLGDDLKSPYITETVNTGDLGKWFLLVCDDVWDENGLNENKVTVADIFEFEANVTVGSMSNNTDFLISKNFTRYPKVQHSPSNYWSGTLGGLLGVISSGSRFTQTPEMLRRFKALTTDNRRKFLKDRDGNLWEISLSAANTIETNSKLDNQLKTASITWVEVADTANTMIYLDNYTDATWLQEENTLVSGPYNGRTQF